MTEIDHLTQAVLAGRYRALAQAVSLVEREDPSVERLLAAIYPKTGKARIVGITGSPGAGKSTLVASLAKHYRKADKRVGIIAVDPTSPFSGGAILGDRIRMQRHALDPGVFIRSLATRGHLGGLSRSTFDCAHVLDAMGFERILIETVGVGQDEVDVMKAAHTTVVVTVPGLGDDIQAIKAGVLEIADVLVVNKADKPGADETARDLTQMLSLGKGRTQWKPPIVRTSAQDNTGIAALAKAIDAHVEWSVASGDRDMRRAGAARQEVEALLREALVKRLEDRIGQQRVTDAVARVAKRELDPYRAVDELLADR